MVQIELYATLFCISIGCVFFFTSYVNLVILPFVLFFPLCFLISNSSVAFHSSTDYQTGWEVSWSIRTAICLWRFALLFFVLFGIFKWFFFLLFVLFVVAGVDRIHFFFFRVFADASRLLSNFHWPRFMLASEGNQSERVCVCWRWRAVILAFIKCEIYNLHLFFSSQYELWMFRLHFNTLCVFACFLPLCTSFLLIFSSFARTHCECANHFRFYGLVRFSFFSSHFFKISSFPLYTFSVSFFLKCLNFLPLFLSFTLCHFFLFFFDWITLYCRLLVFFFLLLFFIPSC